MIIYISGPITGDPDAPAKFAQAEQALMTTGHFVLNPFSVPACSDGLCEGEKRNGHTWTCWLSHDLKALLDCNAVASLPGWKQSPGSLLEHHVARELGFTIQTLEQWLWHTTVRE